MKSPIVHPETRHNALNTAELDALIPDLPSGPLDQYRKSSRFNWKILKVNIEKPEFIKLKNKIWKTLENDKEFQYPPFTLSSDEQKRRTTRQVTRIHHLKHEFITPDVLDSGFVRRMKHLMAFNEALALVNRNLSIKFGLGVTLFRNCITSLGTQRHSIYGEKAWRGELFGCLAITEIGHGSNTKNIKTTATYDPKTKEFVVHTPDFEGAKCWVGNLGRTCTHALLFAQLITADGENHGLHGFLIPVREPSTMLPYDGITVGDMGEKNGLNGIDNGFVIFNQYRIPKECLLNRTGDIGEDGSYESSFTNPQQILGAALEMFNTGRVAIVQEATVTLCCAVTIAVRYGAVRRQFGPKDEETPILEYPLHQWRLFPYLAAAVVFRIFTHDFVDDYLEIINDSLSSTVKHSNLAAIVGEIHAIVSSCKPLTTWVCRDALQECREACGGHGFLKASNLGDLRTDHDPSVTYEGDNNVLLQQASNWILRQATTDREQIPSSPFETVKFLNRCTSILSVNFAANKHSDVANLNFVFFAFEWLLCWLVKETDEHLSGLQSRGVSKFTARTQAQVYKARTLSLAYAQNNALNYVWKRITKPGLDPDVKIILEKLCLIYGLWCIDKYLSYFYQGGFAIGPNFANLVRDNLLSLCRDIVPDAVAVADAIAPEDFALNSVIGKADGRVYENLKTKLLNQPGAMERPSWWKDAVPSAISKL